MAELIISYWAAAKIVLATYRDGWCVAVDMDKGGCLDAGMDAMVTCNPQFFQPMNETVNGKPIPADLKVEDCVRATAAFRRCMQCKPDVFGKYIAAMDKGIEEDARLRLDPNAEVEDGPMIRWWAGMRNS